VKGYSVTMKMLVIPSDDKTQVVYRNDDKQCQYVPVSAEVRDR